MVLWDIMGQASGRHTALPDNLFFPDSTPTPQDVVQGSLDSRADQFRYFQLKPGKGYIRDIDEEIEQIEAVAAIRESGDGTMVDANTNWIQTEAIRAAKVLRDLPTIIEQPCRTREECIAFTRHCSLPIKLDELMETPQDIIRVFEAGILDVVAIKITRVGALNRVREMRDLVLDLGLSVVADDACDSEIVSSP